MNYYFYILSNKKNGTLYVGSTNNIYKRIEEHRNNKNGFVFNYKLWKLVHLEISESRESVSQREKSVKRWRRSWKIILIEKENPNWDCLLEKEFNHRPRVKPEE